MTRVSELHDPNPRLWISSQEIFLVRCLMISIRTIRLVMNCLANSINDSLTKIRFTSMDAYEH